mmetsp:Transcript_17137/g.58663  ORF Transcript_17137/g.58663 Transcript_17137/m.58663 type:complete len:261 (-) Transcript_17137:24-806(-)
MGRVWYRKALVVRPQLRRVRRPKPLYNRRSRLLRHGRGGRIRRSPSSRLCSLWRRRRRASSPHLVPWGGGAVGGVALDFGCGVGRLAAALATKFSTVICVDHSATHLDVARTSIARLHPSRSNRVVFVPTEAAGLEAAEAGVDFALSLLTLQHAVPQVQVAALEHMCDALRVGGLGYAQLLTFYEGSPYVQADCDPARAIGEPGMHLHFLPLAEATRHLAERGCAVLATSRCDGHVRIPNRNSESHCVTFAKLPTRRPEI